MNMERMAGGPSEESMPNMKALAERSSRLSPRIRTIRLFFARLETPALGRSMRANT
jgi:hypothetical protein